MHFHASTTALHYSLVKAVFLCFAQIAKCTHLSRLHFNVSFSNPSADLSDCIISAPLALCTRYSQLSYFIIKWSYGRENAKWSAHFIFFFSWTHRKNRFLSLLYCCIRVRGWLLANKVLMEAMKAILRHGPWEYPNKPPIFLSFTVATWEWL